MRCRHAEWRAWALLTGLAVVVFEGWPGLDLWVARQFEGAAGTFPANDWWTVQAVYWGVPWVGRGLFIACLGLLLWARWRPQQIAKPLARRAAALALMLLLGLTGVVHGVLKEHWGRPRPVQVTELGGAQPFQPALHPSHYCQRNCSFVSGHAATGFTLVVVGIFGSRRTRWRWVAIGAISGLLIGLVRMAQGGHFASDIVFGMVVMWGLSGLLREVWLRMAVRRRRVLRSNAASLANR